MFRSEGITFQFLLVRLKVELASFAEPCILKFQFLLVRLKVFTYREQGYRIRISIPTGTIKRLFYAYVEEARWHFNSYWYD